jgi:hypothetical protein
VGYYYNVWRADLIADVARWKTHMEGARWSRVDKPFSPRREAWEPPEHKHRLEEPVRALPLRLLQLLLGVVGSIPSPICRVATSTGAPSQALFFSVHLLTLAACTD